MIKLLPNTPQLREKVYKTLQVHAPKLKKSSARVEFMILGAFSEYVGWSGRLKPSFKIRYNLLAAALTYWCYRNPHRGIRNWIVTGQYPQDMAPKYKLSDSKAKKFLELFKDEVLFPHRKVLGIFNDPFMRDLYDCLDRQGLIRLSVQNVYKTIRW